MRKLSLQCKLINNQIDKSMKINEELSNLHYAFGVCQEDEINSYNRYLGRLYELKFELEDALEACTNEIKKVEQERKPS